MHWFYVLMHGSIQLHWVQYVGVYRRSSWAIYFHRDHMVNIVASCGYTGSTPHVGGFLELYPKTDEN